MNKKAKLVFLGLLSVAILSGCSENNDSSSKKSSCGGQTCKVGDLEEKHPEFIEPLQYND